jgi:hypothetical protein
MKIAKDSRGLFFDMIKKEAANNKEIKGLVDDILSGAIKTEDYEMYSIRQATETTKMFKTDDDKRTGIRSLAKAQLEKGQFMLVTRIQVLACIVSDATNSDVLALADFGSIKAIPGLQNGEFSWKSNDKYLIKEHSNHTFITDNNSTINLGTHHLENPRLLIQLDKIEFEFNHYSSLPNNIVYKLILGGTGTLPN